MTTPVDPNDEVVLVDDVIDNVIPLFPDQPVVPEPPNEFGELDLSDPQCVAKRIWNIKHLKGLNAWQKARLVENFVILYENSKTTTKLAWLRERDGSKCYLFEGRSCRLYNIDDQAFPNYLYNTYGLNPIDRETKQLVAALKAFASAKGLIRDMRRFSYWDKNAQALYISGYDQSCYRIIGHEDVFIGVTFIPNGHGPVIFIDDDGGKPLQDPQLGNHRRLFRELIDDLQYAPTTAGGMSPEQQKMCLTVWIFMLAFAGYMETKPLLLVEGAKGSGKSLCLQRIAAAIHGKAEAQPVAKKEDHDFPVKILRSPIMILDDVNEAVDWIRDMLCTYVTGGVFVRRQLYTNDSQYVIKPMSFLSITTNNPVTFRQDQLADRCLIIRLESRKENDGNLGTNVLLDRIESFRDEIFGEWLTWLNEIVIELHKRIPAPKTRTRLAEFANLAHVIGRVFMRHDPADGPGGDWSVEAVNLMLEALEEERSALIMDANDPLIDAIGRWLDISVNQRRIIRLVDLHSELAMSAATANRQFPWRTPNGLHRRLREAQAALAHHFVVTCENNENNVTLYSFERI